jgi:phosphohistidine phosphatase
MPKTLYLVRHAKSSWEDASLTDKQRPLSERGLRDAPDMGVRLAEQGHRPDLIISSPAKRAYSTAREIANKLDYEASGIVKDERLYFAGTGSMLKMLEALDDKHGSVMIVGHNPAMTTFLNVLCETPVHNMPTCAVAVVGYDVDSWSDLTSEDGNLLAYDFPKGSGNFTSID